MPSLSDLQRLRWRDQLETWFPSKYSEDPVARLRQRQEACKAFIFGPLKTMDAQERLEHPIKRIPRIRHKGEDIGYLEVWIDGLVRERKPVSPKIRRQIITLGSEGYCLWRAMERPGTYIASVHAKLEDGQRHIEEDVKQVMWAALPNFLTDLYTVGQAKGELRLTHRQGPDGRGALWDSWIIPYPTGSSQLRGFGHAVILWDEYSTHPGAAVAVKGIMPTLVGRTLDAGQIIRIGTVNPDTPSGRHFKEVYEAENFKRARMAARYGIGVLGGPA